MPPTGAQSLGKVKFDVGFEQLLSLCFNLSLMLHSERATSSFAGKHLCLVRLKMQHCCLDKSIKS